MSEHTVTPKEWVSWFLFVNPKWDDKIGRDNLANIPEFLAEVRDTGHFNMLSTAVTWIIASACGLTEKEAEEHLLMWIRSFK